LSAKYLKVLISYLVVLVDGILFRALKFIYDDTDSTYEELLAKSKLPTLKIRRVRTIAIETFKVVNKSSPMYLHD
jgi:hypothetical protein